MIKNIALRLTYNGTAYHGWQIQKNADTVEETVERALARILKHPVKVIGCGRTDAGVHAMCYCANFKTECRIPVDRLPLAMNTVLPSDIVVTDACEAPEDFNAILSCIKKEYTYKIYNSRIGDPFLNDRAYFYPSHLDETVMQRAAAQFLGKNDFAAVRSVGTETKTTVRMVYWYDVAREGKLITLRVCANGFLYNMARAMAGTLIYAAEGKINPESIGKILKTRDRCLTGPTVPACGLYMSRIWYDGVVGEMMLK